MNMARTRNQINACEIGPIKKKLHKAIDKYDPITYPLDIAGSFLSTCTEHEISRLALQAIFDEVNHYRRSKVLSVERTNTQVSATSDCDESVDLKKFERIRLDASLLYGSDLVNRERLTECERVKFRQWCGKERFLAWYIKAECAAEETDRRLNEPSGHISIVDQLIGIGNIHTERDEVENDWDESKIRKRVRIALESDILKKSVEYARGLRLKLTPKFLNSHFAIGDGRVVTWGNATVEEHRERISLLMTNASANAEAASRHQSAINTIESNGVSCLSELPMD